MSQLGLIGPGRELPGVRPLTADDRVAHSALAAQRLPPYGWRVVEHVGHVTLDSACREAHFAADDPQVFGHTLLGAWLEDTQDLPLLLWYAGFFDDLDVVAPQARQACVRRQLLATGEIYLASGVDLAGAEGARETIGP